VGNRALDIELRALSSGRELVDVPFLHHLVAWIDPEERFGVSMFNIGTQELLIILLVVLVLFGAKRIPEVSRALGKGVADLRDALSGVERELKGETLVPPRRPPGAPPERAPGVARSPNRVPGEIPQPAPRPGEVPPPHDVAPNVHPADRASAAARPEDAGEPDRSKDPEE
jgi:sec-independent protein translocase protein TatA